MPPTIDAGIDGVALTDLEPHADDRGSLTEVYRRAWIPDGRETVQANLSQSRPGVLRGLHWHRRQRDYWCVLAGRATVVLVDLRRGSSTERRVALLPVDAADRRIGISIPPGVAHGFETETEVTLLYLVDAYYTGQDEFGLAWDDPDLAIAWPDRSPVLSDRDRSNPRFAAIDDRPVYDAR